MCRSSMRTFRIQSPIARILPSLFLGELPVVKIMAGILACDSSSGRLPNRMVSDMLPIVLAYSGGSAEELHLASLSSLCRHRDPVFSCG